jgi:hypothetical protein
MATDPASNSMSGIIPVIAIETDGGDGSSSAPDKKSSSELEMPMLSLSGGSSKMPVASKASIARYSGTKARTDHQALSDKQMQSLITCGLVKGITHTSIRRQFGAAIRASVLWPLDGDGQE